MKEIRYIVILIILIMLTSCGKAASSKSSVTEAPVTEATTEVITTTEATTEVSTTEQTVEANPREGITIAIDPGHQGPNVDMSAKEPNAPGSTVMKTKATSGTTGRYTHIPEYQLNLDISLMLRDRLEELGYKIIMTREDNDTAISNSERATLANDSGADISIRIHANGSESASQNGALTLTSSPNNPYVGKCYNNSVRLANCILDHYCERTGMKNLGNTETDTMTGINWSTIPVMILEMGFMTNESDDVNMQNKKYQKRMVAGIVDGIEEYYSFEDGDSKIDVKVKTTINKGLKAFNCDAACSYISLNDGREYLKNSKPMVAASLIKLYIAGTVYENFDLVAKQEQSKGETNTLLKTMISVSDNDAANTLVRRLGKGNEQSGMKLVNRFCSNHNYSDTKMNRLMLVNDGTENYTSVGDVAHILNDYYNSKLQGSDDIIAFMKDQERRSKIPAGIPNEVIVANKTGELASVENDAAIVYKDNNPYILCVMTNNVTANGDTVKGIVRLSENVYGLQ